MTIYEIISINIMTLIGCGGIVYGTIRLMAWLDKRRELMELSIEYYKKQLSEMPPLVRENKSKEEIMKEIKDNPYGVSKVELADKE